MGFANGRWEASSCSGVLGRRRLRPKDACANRALMMKAVASDATPPARTGTNGNSGVLGALFHS